MNKIVELPLLEPIYQTYHYGIGTAALVSNPSIRNWYLSNVFVLTCNRKFLFGFTTPEVDVLDVRIHENPHLILEGYAMLDIKENINQVIRNLIDEEYYIDFSGVDDYYIEGKSWYKKRHFCHDGAICGYNQIDKTYCMYAYDEKWVYRKFWTPQSGFDEGREAMFREGSPGIIFGIKPKPDYVPFSVHDACKKITEYMDSTLEKYPEDGEGNVYGVVVHDYIVKYVDKLRDGSIPYERMDWRVFRIIWEQKKVLLETIQCIEKELCLSNKISSQYALLTIEADNIRMLYAAHHMKRKDGVLPIIQKKLMAIKEKECELLYQLLRETGEKSNEIVDIY